MADVVEEICVGGTHVADVNLNGVFSSSTVAAGQFVLTLAVAGAVGFAGVSGEFELARTLGGAVEQCD